MKTPHDVEIIKGARFNAGRDVARTARENGQYLTARRTLRLPSFNAVCRFSMAIAIAYGLGYCLAAI